MDVVAHLNVEGQNHRDRAIGRLHALADNHVEELVFTDLEVGFRALEDCRRLNPARELSFDVSDEVGNADHGARVR